MNISLPKKRDFTVLNNISLLALLVGFISAASVARADFTWDFVEDTDASTVTGTYSGMWNFNSNSNTSAFGVSTSAGFPSHSGGGWLLMHSNASLGYVTSPQSRSGSLPWTGAPKAATSVVGDDWGHVANFTYGPTGFTSSTSIAGSFVWTSSTLASLNFTGSGGSFTIGSTPIVWTATTASAVPEPSQFAMVLGAVSLGAMATRRRRQSSPQAHAKIDLE